MIAFLTSNPFLHGGSGLNPANGFADALRSGLPKRPLRGLFVASSADDPETNDFYCAEQRGLFEASGVSFESFVILDRRTENRAAALVAEADLIILTGGHVPTQNRFFHRIGLRALLRGFTGTLVGISAGTMNAAETVYAQPELEGEAASPAYRRFLPGLGLTRAMVIPHFDGDLDVTLDGLGVYADVTFPDSRGRRFFAIPDGSYLLVQNGVTTLFGEARLIEDGAIRPFCVEGESARL